MLKPSNKNRKNEQIETIAIIDRCTKIMKEDRLALRQLVKDDNVKLIELVAKHKKRTDLNDLQTELRKFIKEKKGSTQDENNQQPILLRKVKSKERYEWTANVRSPSRSHLDFRKKHKDESFKKQDSIKKIDHNESGQKSSRNQNLREKILNNTSQEMKTEDNRDNTQLVKKTDEQDEQIHKTAKSITQPFQDDLTPIKMEFQTIVSQAPLNQSDQRSECVLQYNVAELQQYMQQDKHYVSKSAYAVPQLMSFGFRSIAPENYRDMFTDWKSLLQQVQPEYSIKKPHILPQEFETQEFKIETEESIIHEDYQQQTILENNNNNDNNSNNNSNSNTNTNTNNNNNITNSSTYQQEQQFKLLEIRGVTAEELFTYLVHNRFSKRLNLYQIKENARQSIPDAQIDFDQLFKLADKDNDGWITLEELGCTLQDSCSLKETQPNNIKQLFIQLDGHVNKETFMEALNDKIQAEILYHEIDLFGKGNLSYWELYNHFEEIEKYI